MSMPATDLRRSAELWAIQKMRPSIPEYRALVDRFADSVQLMQLASANESFEDFCAAWLSLHDICHQATQLNLGIAHAIEACHRVEF
jgi:hypothetical protein